MATKKKTVRKPLTTDQLNEEKGLFAEQVLTAMAVAKTVAAEVFGEVDFKTVNRIFGYLEFDEDGNPPEDTSELVAQLKVAQQYMLDHFGPSPENEDILQLHENMHEDFISSDDFDDE